MGCWHWRFHSVPSRRSRKHGSLFRGTGFSTIFPLIHVVVVVVVYVYCFPAPQFRKEPTIFIRSPECTPKLSEQDDIIVKYTHAFASDRDTIHRPNIQHPRICNTAGYIVDNLRRRRWCRVKQRYIRTHEMKHTHSR